MKLIERIGYLKKMIDVAGTPDIKVITGIRRSGKSKLLEAFIENRKGLSPECNIIHVNFNLTEFEGLMEYHKLYDFVNSRYIQGQENVVCIDEIQMCSGFEKAINSLHECGKYDIYITGSNAFLLSSDLATLFTGRAYEIEYIRSRLRNFAHTIHQATFMKLSIGTHTRAACQARTFTRVLKTNLNISAQFLTR